MPTTATSPSIRTFAVCFMFCLVLLPGGAVAGQGTATGASGCVAENLFPAAGRADGWNGLAIEYAVTGLAISEFTESSHKLVGYPTGTQVSVAFIVHGPFSIEGSHATDGGVVLNGQTVQSFRAPDQGGAKGWTQSLNPVVVTITDAIRREGFHISASVGYARSSNAEIVFVDVVGKGCESPTVGSSSATSADGQTSPQSQTVGAGTNNGSLPGSDNWGLVVGGGALAAVAAGVAGAYWKRRRQSGDPGDSSDTPPGGPVGYVLQLSSDQFTLNSGERAPLTATVWAVDSTGATSLAGGASIVLNPPAGIIATSSAGSGRLMTSLMLAANAAPGSYAVNVSAQAGGSTYQAMVTITAAGANNCVLHLEPTAINLTQSGAERIRASVVVTGPDGAASEAESQRLSAAITFALTGPCAGWFSARDSYEGGSRVGILDLTIPDNVATLKGPFTATYTASVKTPTGTVQQACVLTISPSDQFELAMDPTLRLTANDVAGSLLCCIVCKDPTIADADALIMAATPGIQFVAAGNEAHWLNEHDGDPGMLVGELSGGRTPGKEVHPEADVPESDLSLSGPFNASITASVTIPRYGAFTQVSSVAIAPPSWFVELQPVKDKLQAGIDDFAEFRVRVLPELDAKIPAYVHDGVNVLNQYLEFGLEGPAAPFGLLGELEGDSEFRRLEVRLTDIPKGTRIGDYLDVVAEAVLCGQRSRQKFRIHLSGKPELVVTEKTLSLVSDGPPTTIHAKVKNGDEFTWELRVETIKLPFVVPDGRPETTDDQAFALSIRCDAIPDDHFGFVNGLLRLSAHTKHPETREEIWTEPVDVKVQLGRVGLSVSPSPVRLPLSPTAPPTVFRVRVVRYNEEKRAFEVVPRAMTALDMDEWEDGDASGGGNIFKGAGVTLISTGKFEGTGTEQVALWQAKYKLEIPAANIIDAMRTLTAPGDYGDEQDLYTTQHTFFAPADPAAAASDRLRVEQANCRKVLRFVPEGKAKARFAEIIERDARMLGAEGLRHIRTEIWSAARDSLEKEAASYLNESARWDLAYKSCDWTAYVCGLLLQGIASVACPFPTDLVVNVLYTAIPEMANAVIHGESLETWVKNWARGFYEGLPGMGGDMALGLVINLEDLVKQGLKEFKDLRKACLAACMVFWQSRFFRYMAMPRADGEPHSTKECVMFALRDLVEEVVQTGVGKNARFHAENMKLPGVTGWVKDYDPTTGHGFDPQDGRVYHEGTKPPDTTGMPTENLRAAQNIARQNGVEIYVRPTNTAAKKLLEGGAIPKPEKIKAKTINEVDLKLGRRAEDLGKVGYFDPGAAPPPQGTMTKKEYAEVVDRFKQRKQEFVDNKKDFTKLEHEHPVTKNGEVVEGVTERVTVDAHGVVTNHTTRTGPDGKPVTEQKVYTGDHDIYDIRGKNGEPLDPATYDRVFKQLQDSKFQAQHPGHRQWDYSKADKYPPPPAKDAQGEFQPQQSKFKKASGIDEKIKDSHQSAPSSGKDGEAIIKVDSEGSLTGVFANPPKVTDTTGGRLGKAGSQSASRNQREMENP